MTDHLFKGASVAVPSRNQWVAQKYKEAPALAETGNILRRMPFKRGAFELQNYLIFKVNLNIFVSIYAQRQGTMKVLIMNNGPKRGYGVLLSLLLLLSSSSLFAQFRKYSNEFLNIGAGARGLAMSGAQVASVKDGTSGYWNPAGLVNVQGEPQLNLMHAEYFAGIGKYDFASLVLPMKNQQRVLGLTLLRFAVDDIPNTIFLVEPDGTINFSKIETFSSADYAFLLSLAQSKKFKNGLRIDGGVNAKIIHRKAGKFASAWGFGFDAGVQMQYKRWKFGAVARDVTTTFNAWSFNLTDRMREVFFVTQNEIPVKSTELTAPRLLAGASYLFKCNASLNILAEMDVDITWDGRRNTVVSSSFASIDPKFGLEASWKDILFLRAGINNFQKALDDADATNTRKIWIYQPAVGVGFKVSNVQIDYAFTNLANQSNPLYTHVISLKTDLKKKATK